MPILKKDDKFIVKGSLVVALRDLIDLYKTTAKVDVDKRDFLIGFLAREYDDFEWERIEK